MASNLNGWGQFCLRQEGNLSVIRAAGVSIADEVTSETANAYPSGATGVLGAVDTFGTARTTTVTLTLESVDSSDFDLISGYRTENQTSTTFPVFKVVTVPATSPYTVTETGLAADQDVEATLISSTAPGNLPMTQDGSAPNAALEYQVTSNTITFNSTEAGKSVGIYYTKTGNLTAVRGGELDIADLEIGTLELLFSFKSTRSNARRRWYPEVSIQSGGTFEAGADSNEIILIAAVPPTFGGLPYKEWDI